jgi:hypothetical protein
MLPSNTHQDDLAELSTDARWLTVQRIIHSETFRKSTRLPDLLRYLAKESLLNRSSQLTERAVAIRVFERQEDFDPSIDTIVRSQMVRLRQKLDQYATEHENHDSFRIVIPKGDYVVRFEPNPGFTGERSVANLGFGLAESKQTDTFPVSPSPNEILPEPVRHPLAAPHQAAHWAAIGLLSGLCILFAFLLFFRKTESSASFNAKNPLWDALFQENQPTLWVSGDSGLVMLENLGGKEITLEEYLNHDFSRITQGLSPEKLELARNLGRRHYTSITDVTLVNSLSRIATENHSALNVKWARDLNLSDLKRGNVILGGAHLASPWMELIEPNMDFKGVSDLDGGGFHFVNRHPRANEQSIYSVSWKDPAAPGVLGLVSFMPGLDKVGNMLVIEGSSVTGGEAVLDFLLDDKNLVPFLNSIKQPNGALPYFEVIVGSTNVHGNAGPFHVVAYHTHPR